MAPGQRDGLVMKHRATLGLLLAFALLCPHCWAQVNIAGFWLGVTYPTSPNQAVYNYTMTLTQANSAIGGTAQTANPNVPFGGTAYLSGTLNGVNLSVSEADKNGSTAVKGICFWRSTLTYNPTDESLIGTYETIVNGTTCVDASGGKVELYRIVLKSGATYCKGSAINLLVTGKNIRWYTSAAQTTLLATGNTYSPENYPNYHLLYYSDPVPERKSAGSHHGRGRGTGGQNNHA